jgi:phosphatidylglycerol:prolipoprotein diacylglycerol transferase
MSFHGGLLGAIVAGALFCRLRRLPVLEVTDIVIVTAPIGLGLGRLGNFINAELFGRPSSLPWAMVFPGGGPQPRHPSQLYEVVLEGLLLFVILWTLKDLRMRPGSMLCLFLFGYGLVRFLVEFFREPDPQLGLIWGVLSMGQMLCLAMILTAIILWLLLPRSSLKH